MKALIAATCGLLTLGSAFVARADNAMGANDPATKGPTTTYESGSKMDEASLRKVTLTVKSVDKANHKVTFEAQVAPEAKVQKDGQPIKLDQLKEGDQVRAAFDPKSGEVQKLEISRPGSDMGKTQNPNMK